MAHVTRSHGDWEASLGALQEALKLDPRSASTLRRLATSLLFLRRYPEALATTDQVVALDPRNPIGYQIKAMVFLARGDLPGARAVVEGPALRAASRGEVSRSGRAGLVPAGERAARLEEVHPDRVLIRPQRRPP
ncbi:MAG TPA: tetratricopeptide repeat protein [Gemmatimonadales bacterium]